MFATPHKEKQRFVIPISKQEDLLVSEVFDRENVMTHKVCTFYIEKRFTKFSTSHKFKVAI